MSQTFANPENALKRASELIVVNQKNEAIDVLRTIITSRRFRTWGKPLESVMLKYIGLCVELRKGQEAKDGLHQYRGVCQQVNIASLGVVIKYFLEESERHAKEAQSKAEALNLEALEDLDAEETPESMMLGKVSGEDTKDRTDREIVTPWLKFLWETYRTVLDILRNNPKLEGLYQKTAQQAFAFCKKFKRNTEFRRLCDLLRGHLSNLGKYGYQPNSINIQAPESMQLHLETRFAQLNVACDLELWQEAFRTVEDIHGLMAMAKKPPKSSIMANFYEKLTQIFWVSGNHLFHAYAWHKFYTLSKNHNKGLSAEELKTMAASVLLSALSIPIDTDRSSDQLDDLDDIVQKEKNVRLAALLGPISTPRRDVLLEELRVKSISSQVPAELQDLLYLLEEKFHPLELCEALKPKLEFIAAHPTLKQYLKPLETTVLVRLLQQLERVFQTMKLAELYKLTFFVDPTTLEKALVDMISKGYVDLHIDHKNGALNFGSQNLGSEKLRGQLATLSKGLQSVVDIIQPKDEAAKAERKKKAFAVILQNIAKEHKEALERKKLIEKRKEIKEQMANLLKAQAAAAQKEEEERRSRALRETEERERKEREQKLKEEALKAKEQEPEPEKQKAEVAAKAKKDMETKLQVLAKKMDYLERARRESERPLLEAANHRQQEEGKKYYEEQQASLVSAQEKMHAKQLEEKKRLAKMQPFRRVFEEALLKRREEEFQRKKAEQDERLADIRVKLQKEREVRAVEEARKKQQREEKNRLLREEAERREEEEQREREAAEIKRKHEEEEEAQRHAEERRSREEEAREEEARRAKDADGWRSQERRGEPRREPERRREDPYGRREEPERRREDPFGRRDEPERRREEPERRREDPYGRREEPERRREDPYGRREQPERRREEPERRREDPYGRREEPERRREEPERRREDPYGRREEPERRREDPYGRREEPRRDPGEGPSRRDEGRREEGRRDEWRGRRDEDDGSRRRDEGRKEEPWRGPRRDEGRRDEPRRDEGRRDEGRRDEPRRDVGRRDEGRRDEPRRDEGRRDEGRREEGKDEGRREPSGDNAWRRGGSSNIRAPAEPRESPSPSRERPPTGGRREPERRPPTRGGEGTKGEGSGRAPPAERERERESPRGSDAPSSEAEPSGEGGEGDDGWSTVSVKRGRGRRGN